MDNYEKTIIVMVTVERRIGKDESWSHTAYKPKARSHKFRDRQIFSDQL
jgi:hypothetical protein